MFQSSSSTSVSNKDIDKPETNASRDDTHVVVPKALFMRLLQGNKSCENNGESNSVSLSDKVNHSDKQTGPVRTLPTLRLKYPKTYQSQAEETQAILNVELERKINKAISNRQSKNDKSHVMDVDHTPDQTLSAPDNQLDECLIMDVDHTADSQLSKSEDVTNCSNQTIWPHPELIIRSDKAIYTKWTCVLPPDSESSGRFK